MTVRCNVCGRFISYQDIVENKAKLYFEPDNHFGPEINNWYCKEHAKFYYNLLDIIQHHDANPEY